MAGTGTTRANSAPDPVLISSLCALRTEIAGLTSALADLDGAVSNLVTRLEAGGRPLASYRDARFQATRDEIFAALRSFDAALTAARAQGVRSLIDDEGVSFSEAARIAGRSRQFVTRLYRQATAGG